MKLPLLCVATLSFSLSTVAANPPAPKGDVLQLDPLRVKATPVNSFPLELEVRVSKDRKVVSILIVSVLPDSDASAAGLVAGDEILKINGREVVGMDARVNIEADLAKLLINRPPGEKIHLEVLTKRTKSITLQAGFQVTTSH